jgi:hypothetical protein
MDSFSPEYAGYDLYPDGEYTVTYNYSELCKTRWGPRASLWFAITVGESSGELVPYFCPVEWVNKAKGRTKFAKGSKYEALMRSATGWNGKRRDRCSPSRLKGITFKAKLKTVKERGDETPYSPEECYSKIEKLEKL